MSKVLGVLIGSLFAAGAAMAAGSTDYAKPSMDTSKLPTHPTTAANSPEAAKPSTMDTTKPPTHPAQPSSYSSKAEADRSMGNPAKSYAVNDKDKADKPCPPGLEKKNNGCVPPGHAKANDTRAMGAGKATKDRDDSRKHRRNVGPGHHD
jgi:hypothetical protein